MRLVNFITAAALLLSATPSAFGAPVHVEVVVFANNTAESDGEWFLRPKEIIRVEKPIDVEISEEELRTVETGIPEPISMTDLGVTGPQVVEPYMLTEFVDIIDKNPNFELLNYISWVQEPVPKSKSKPVSLDLLVSDSILSDDLLLAGELMVYEVAQLLQVDVRVTYKPVADTETAVAHLPETVRRYSPRQSYLLDERRQIHINDIHYFDHPKFGVVFTIIRPKIIEQFPL